MMSHLSIHIRRLLFLIALSSILSCGLYAQRAPLSLSLAECIRYHRDSPERSAQLDAQRQGAQAMRRLAQSHYFPQISLSGGWLYTPAKLKPYAIDLTTYSSLGNIPELPFLPSISEVQTWLDERMTIELGHIFYGSVSLRQPLFAGGRIYQGVKLAQIGEEAIDYQWTIRQRSEEAEIAKNYWQATQLQEQLKVIQKFNQLLDKTLSDLTDMHQQGVVAERELLTIRVNRNNAKLQEGKLQEGLEALLILLKHQCHIPPQQEIELTPLDTLSGRYGQEDTTTIWDNPLDRVELKAASLAIEAEARRAKMALGEMLPEVGLTAQILTLSPDPFDGLKKQFGTTWMVGVSLQIPITGIYQGAQNRSLALANKQVRELERQDAERAIKMQYEQASRQHSEALARYTQTQQIRADAQLNLDLSTEGYQAGVVTLETLALAQRNWLEAEMQYIETLVAVRLAQLARNVATGQPIES